MGVYVKGMKMPKECRECYLLEYYEYLGETQCSVTRRMLAERGKPISFDGRPDYCPLVEVSEPHGRLIDENELIQSIDNIVHKAMIFGGQICYSRSDIDNASTVIAAEGE